jgi:hypothetical protein
LAISISFGLAFWLMAALFIRLAPFDAFSGGIGTMLLFAVTVPLAWASVQIGKRVAGLGPDQTLPGLAVASAGAMLCDGIGLLWSPIYGEADRLPGASWILWGVGLILVVAVYDVRRQAR